MKINWAWAIVISFILFIGFIGYFVVRIETEAQLNHELVTEGYYKEELKMESHLTALHNGAVWHDSLVFSKSAHGITIESLPSGQKVLIEGYRASNKQKDFAFYSTINSNLCHIKDSLLLPGKWKISLSWNSNETAFRVEKEIYY